MDRLVQPPVELPTVVTITVPPSKSVALRQIALVAARGAGTVELPGLGAGAAGGGPGLATDIAATLTALEALGVVWARLGDRLHLVEGLDEHATRPVTLQMEDGAAPARFLLALAATLHRPVTMQLGPRLAARPHGPLLDALRGLGVDVNVADDGRAITVQGPMGGGRVAASVAEGSSQYVSALIIAAARARATVVLPEPPPEARGWPASHGYIALTERAACAAGVSVKAVHRGEDETLVIEPGFTGAAPAFAAEGDWSAAAVAFAASAFLQRPVAVPGLDRNSSQPDRAILATLTTLGFSVETLVRHVTAPTTLTGPLTLDVGDTPDLAPALAALGTLVPGGLTLTGAAHLRHKESDRIGDLVALLRAAGAEAEPREDGLTVGARRALPGAPPVLNTCRDHRLVMAAALLGLSAPVVVRDTECVAKSWPGFFDVWPR